MTGPPRLLFLTPFAPRLDAPHGGRVTASLVARMAERHPTALVCIRSHGAPPTDEAIRSSCKLVEEVVRPQESPRGRWRSRAARLRKLAGAAPDLVAHTAVPGYGERLRAAASAFGPDIVQVELHEMAQYLPALEGIPAQRVLVDHDPGASAAQDLSSAAIGARRVWRRLDELAWARFSRETAAAVDAIVVFTERDRRAVERYARGRPVATIPLAVEIPERPLDPRGASPPSLLFFGGFRHPPNADAAVRLLRTIFPCVRERHPDLRLELVGSEPTEEMRRLAGEGVAIRGRVDSVTPYLDRAAVVVAPIRLGGGMRVKVLEALAAGKAVVASPRACEGVSAVHGRDLIVAETDEELCAAVSELVQNEARRVELALSARRYAEQSLGWDRAVAAYEALYCELLSVEMKVRPVVAADADTLRLDR